MSPMYAEDPVYQRLREELANLRAALDAKTAEVKRLQEIMETLEQIIEGTVKI